MINRRDARTSREDSGESHLNVRWAAAGALSSCRRKNVKGLRLLKFQAAVHIERIAIYQLPPQGGRLRLSLDGG